MKKTFTGFLVLAALLPFTGLHAANIVCSADTVPTMDCCVDTTVNTKDDPYLKIVKEGGSVREGLFAVRHIKDDWYLEVPDSLLGRMMLAVTRFTSVPQEFKMVTGEEVNRSAVYFEQYGEKTIFLREYVQSQYAKP